MPEQDNGQGVFTFPYMVRWFSPTLLANAAVRATVSPVFGTFADARAVQANVDGFAFKDLERAVNRHDLSKFQLGDDTGAVWVDYLADTGDGFDSTYAMASLVAEDRLTVARKGAKDGAQLPAGKVLILGGDQVYPYPSRTEYADRFVKPFEMAFRNRPPRLTFVLPGNHDWYDGLNSFDFLFCQARYAGDAKENERETQAVAESPANPSNIGCLTFSQHRSYFAVRLAHNWWIWGADIQFSDYLDSGQTRYFQSVANIMRERRPDEPEHKVILCAAVPGWQYEEREAHAANSNMQLIADIVASANIDRLNAKICAIVSGDAHHYSRYYSKDLGLSLITAGGGGAFLHPTHQLHDDITYRWQGADHKFSLFCRPSASKPNSVVEAAAYPSRLASFWLTWYNIAFPVWNYTFATLLGTFYWLMTWMYSQTPINGREGCKFGNATERKPLVEDILVYQTASCGLQGDTWSAQLNDLIGISIQAGIYQFLLGIFAILMLVALVMYADSRKRWKKVLIGFVHWLVHLAAMVGLYWVVNYINLWGKFSVWINKIAGTSLAVEGLPKTIAYMTQMILAGGFVAGIVWGIYLFISCAFFKRHWNEAFSALRLPDYKNFLRMKLEADRLTIYPIGLRRTPTRLEWSMGKGADAGRYVSMMKLSPELIDGPIVIEAANVVGQTAKQSA